MVLHAKYRLRFMSHAFDSLVVEIDPINSYVVRQCFRVDGKSVILRSDGNFAAPQIFYRLIGPAMAEFQFERRPAEGKAKNLMAETYPEDRFFAQQIPDRGDGIIERPRISRPI